LYNDDVYDKWTKFKDDNVLLFNPDKKRWLGKYTDLNTYINKYNRCPRGSDKDIVSKRLGEWISTNKQNYRLKRNIMKDMEIYDKWTLFENKYIIPIKTDKEKWIEKYNNLCTHLDNFDKFPSGKSNDLHIKQLYVWKNAQVQKYKTKKGLMKDDEIYNTWKASITSPKYNKYFK
jgi:hypothetical protein